MRLKQEKRRLNSYTKDGIPMYPGDHIFTWVETIPGVWTLVAIEPIEEQAP